MAAIRRNPAPNPYSTTQDYGQSGTQTPQQPAGDVQVVGGMENQPTGVPTPPEGTPPLGLPAPPPGGGDLPWGEQTGHGPYAPPQAPGGNNWTAPWQGSPDVGGYSVPGWTESNYGTAPSGWDPTKWMDPQHQTPKYVVGRIFQGGQMAGLSLDQIVQHIQQAYPGSTWNGRDIINIPGIGNVDFVRDFGGENGISWQPEADNQGGGSMESLLATLQSQIGGAHMPQSPGGGGGASGGGPAATGPAPSGDTNRSMIWQTIQRLLDPSQNQDTTNQRVESARETLERQRRAGLSENAATLAQRGLSGQGPEITSTNSLDSRLNEDFASTVRDINSDESARADQRALQALSLGTGLSVEEAQDLIDWFNAQTQRDVGMGNVANDAQGNAITRELGLGRLGLDRELGLGQLDLGRLNSEIGWNEFLGQLGLDRDNSTYAQQHGNTQDLLGLLQLILAGSGQAGGGYV